MAKLRLPPEPKESDEQRHVFLWAQRVANLYPGLELLNASMNGAWIPGGKSKAERGRKFGIIRKLKELGCLKSGFPDISLPVPKGRYYGLYIELKRKSGGRVEKNQEWWLDRLNRQGYMAVVAWGADEAIEVILGYLELRSKNHEKQKTGIPAVIFCPYCGAKGITSKQGVSRCEECRAIFFITYSRPMKSAPKKVIK